MLAANAVSITGTTMTVLAVPWFVLVTTGSAAKTGVVAACETIPLVLSSGLGGPLIERVGARRTAIASDLLSALGIALIPLLHATVGLQFWELCVVVALVGLVRAPGDTSHSVLLPQLQELAHMPVERATSAFDGVSRGARMVGAPLAGALIAALGPADVLLVDAATFLVSMVLIRAGVPPVTTEPTEHEPYLQSLREGFRWLRADRLLLGMVSMVMLTNLLDAASGSVLSPVYGREVLHSSVQLGFLYATFGLGALTGTVLYGIYGPRLPRWPVFTAAFIIVGAPRFWLLAVHPSYAVLVAGQVVTGLACGALNPVLSAVEYERIPAAMQSRVFGVMSAGVLAGMPVGAALAGLSVDQLGLDTTLVVAGALYLAATVSPLVWARTWRQMDATRSRGGDDHVDQHLDLVTDLQRAEHL
jgi:MFS family permease